MSAMSDGDLVKTAESGLIGLALLRPAAVRDLDLEPRHFFDPRWERAWAVIRDLLAQGLPVDEVTVAQRMPQGDAMVVELTKCTLGTIPILPEEHAAIVRTAWVTRQVLLAFSACEAANKRDGVSGEELLSMALERLASVNVEQPAAALSIGALARTRYLEVVANAEARLRGDTGASGLPTGVRELDELIGGLQPGICTTVAGRPAMGKSAFGMTVVDAVSRAGHGAHVFSLEDIRSAYADRSMSRGSGVPCELIRTGALDRRDLAGLLRAAQELHERRGWIVDDRAAITAEEIVRSVRRELKQNRTRLVVVDYVQLLKAPPGFREATDKTKVAEHAINVLADAAKQDDLAYLVLSQINRECEKRENKRPMLGDLKQSGAIEERSKCVLMLYRPAVYREVDPQTSKPYPETVLEVLVRKHTQGRTGKVVAHWDGPTTSVA